MKVTLLCSDETHPINSYLQRWIEHTDKDLEAELVRQKNAALGGDILFLISCSEIVTATDRGRYRHTLVLHASDLPAGRGWSPHVWEISQGATFITLSLLEAAESVDSGKIWKKMQIPVPEHAIWDEINELLFEAEVLLIDFAIKNAHSISPMPQSDNSEATYNPRRTPRDSMIDPNKCIAEQFNLIRVCDPNRFPAYFMLHGKKYILKVEKRNE